MLLRCMIMFGVAVALLALAACAETGGAIASAAAMQAADIAATQVEALTTQYATDIEQAATQMAAGQSNPAAMPAMQNANGTYIIDTPNATIILVKGHRYIVLKDPYVTGNGDNH